MNPEAFGSKSFNKYRIKYLILVCLSLLLTFFFKTSLDKHHLTVSRIYSSHGYYEDIDFDGTLERFSLSGKSEFIKNSVVLAYDSADRIINQWNIKGNLFLSFDRPGEIYFADLNDNGYKELYFFTQVSDSLFLNSIDFFPGSNNYARWYIDSLQVGLTESYSYLFQMQSANMDGKAGDELIFNIRGYYSIYPRKTGILSPGTGKVILSNGTGNGTIDISLVDLDMDGIPEITGMSSSPGNVRNESEVIYSDSSAWLFLMDQQLSLLFPPHEFPVIYASLSVLPIEYENEKCLLVLLLSNSLQRPDNNVFIFDKKGTIKFQRFDPELKTNFRPSMLNKQFILISAENKVLTYDFRTGRKENLFRFPREFNDIGYFQCKDLDGDSSEELILLNRSGNKLVVFNDSKNDVTKMNMSNPNNQYYVITASDATGQNEILLQIG